MSYFPLFLAGDFLGSLGDLASSFLGLNNRLDDTDGDGLSHVTDGKTSERRVVSKGLDTHWLGWHHLDDSRITRLDEFGSVLDRFTGTTVDLLKDFREFACNVGGVAIKDWCVTSTDLARVVQDDDLSVERVGPLWRVALGVTSDITTTNLLDRNVLDVESDVVSGKTFDELLVVHLDGLDFSGNVGGGESNDLLDYLANYHVKR